MSLFGALSSAVSGLEAQSSALSAISTNIANASTTGYKISDTSFDSLVAVTDGSGTYGLGVSTSGKQEMAAQGQISSTTTTTNMAIDGTGLFVVSASTSGGTSSTDLFTRNGSFSTDANGYLVNSQGDYLLGYATDASGAVTSSSAGTLGGLTAIKIPQATTVSGTTTASLSANLPADLATGSSVSTTMNVVDSLGNTQTIGETWTKTANNSWTVSLSNPYTTDSSGNKTTTGTISPSSVTVAFDSSGVLSSTNPSPASITLSGLSGGAANQTFTWNLGTAGKTDGLTQYASSDGSAKISITGSTQDGSSAGSLSSVSVGKDGTITAKYSNNTTTVVGKVPVATFADQQGLTEVNGSTYTASATSGPAVLDTAGTDGAGTIKGEALEASTTDTSAEFNKMIVAQQAYSAAAQVVTYVNKMFTSLVQAVG